MVSVIIPTRGNIDYLDECIKSILDQKCDKEFEILLGVDACAETVEHSKRNPEIYGEVRIFDFTKIFGPYVVKNTLANFARYDNLIFFDSDDIMADGALQNFCDSIGDAHFGRLNFIEFETSKENIDEKSNLLSGSSIGIKSDPFLKINGFYDWTYGADLEFIGRISYEGFIPAIIPGIFYYKRNHEKSLTVELDTNPIKKVYLGIVKKNREEKDWPSPEHRITGKYIFL
jgi:glycosyltransferase involved in cell wall biosynthesis